MKRAWSIILAAAMLASAGCGSSTGTSTDNTDIQKKSEGVMTYAEYEAAELDSKVTVETFIQGKQSWWDNKATFYTQDQDGGYFIYEMPLSEEEYNKLAEGTKIKVTGYKSEWAGEVEIIDAEYEIESGTYVAEPLDVTNLLGTDDLASRMNMKVAFKGMTVEAAGKDSNGNDVSFLYNWDGSGQRGDDVYFNVSKDGNTYTFTIRHYLTDENSEVYKDAENLQIGDVVDLEGFLYWYEGANPHITSIQSAK